MAYELRIPGDPPARFEEQHEAVKAAEAAMRRDRTVRIELIDLATSHPATIGDRRNWHEEYKKSLGF